MFEIGVSEAIATHRLYGFRNLNFFQISAIIERMFAYVFDAIRQIHFSDVVMCVIKHCIISAADAYHLVGLAIIIHGGWNNGSITFLIIAIKRGSEGGIHYRVLQTVDSYVVNGGTLSASCVALQ